MRIQVRLPDSAIEALAELAAETGTGGVAEAVRWLLAGHVLTPDPAPALAKIRHAADERPTTPIRAEIPEGLWVACAAAALPGEAVSATVRRLIYEAAGR